MKLIHPTGVNMIITKRGDSGKTSLLNGKRVWKDDRIIEALGSLDELSSFIGLVRSKIKRKNDQKLLITIQKNLYQIMAVIAGSKENLDGLKESIGKIERLILEKEKKLPKIIRFILPDGEEISSWFHILRVISRNTERKVVACFKKEKILKKNKNQKIIFAYLNRLSDLFFILAREFQTKEETLV